MDLIVAVDQNWAIGKDGEQLLYLSQDLKRFKALTLGHAVILGRRTLSTFPGGRPLKGRRNLILSTTPDFAPEGGEVYPSLDALLAAAPADAFVIGGAQVYRLLLPACRRLYVTQIDADGGADVFFPEPAPLSSAGSPSTAPFWTGAAPPMSLRSWPSTPQTGTSRTWMPTLAGSRWRSQNSWRRTEYASGM